MSRLAFLALFLGACTDYNLQGDPNVYGTPNPPDLSPPVQTDRIVQVPVPAVDVLWVIDNSCSMAEEQQSLTDNFPKFMDYFTGSGLDYHVGVVSTDNEYNNAGDGDQGTKGKLRTVDGQKWIQEDSTEQIKTFTKMAKMGTDGSVTEQGRKSAWNALVTQKDQYNAGFLRDDAYLSIVVISDEEDQSGSNPSLDEFITWLKDEAKPEPGMVSFSSIVGPRPDGCYSASGAAEAGKQYLQVTDEVGGIEWSICDGNWDTVLEELGIQAAGLKHEFFLSQVPVEDSITVWVETNGKKKSFDVGTDYVYDRSRNSITFNSYVPKPLANVYIEYQVLAGWTEADTDTDAP